VVWVVVGFFLFGVLLFFTLNTHKKYKSDHPVTTLPGSEVCRAQGLVAHWNFDTITSDIVPDSSKFENDGNYQFWFHQLTKYIFGTPGNVEGVLGSALEFRGRQWVSGGNTQCFSTEKFTIAAWVWQESDDVKKRVIVPTIMAKSSWPYDGWWLCSTTKGIGEATRNREIDLGIAWGNGFVHVRSGYQLPLREWHHIVVSVDNVRNEVQFFIDGEPREKQTGVHGWRINWNHDLFIGEYDGSGRWPWQGKLDDVRFFNTILSSADVADLLTEKMTRVASIH
jgi:hypothetical protein